MQSCVACGYALSGIDQAGRCPECGLSILLSRRYDGVSVSALTNMLRATWLLVLMVSFTSAGLLWVLLAATVYVPVPDQLSAFIVVTTTIVLNCVAWLTLLAGRQLRESSLAHVVCWSAGLAAVVTGSLLLTDTWLAPLAGIFWSLSFVTALIGIFARYQNLAEWLNDERMLIRMRRLGWMLIAYFSAGLVIALGIGIVRAFDAILGDEVDSIMLAVIGAWSLAVFAIPVYAAWVLLQFACSLRGVLKKLTVEA